MKRILLAILLAGCTLAMSAQMKVNYKGSKPAIDDFIWALVTYSTEETDADHESINAVRDAMERYRQGASQPKNITFTVDKQNGYALYESKQDETLVRVDMCYWNEADGKHKIFAFNTTTFMDGKSYRGEFDGIMFYRYDNITKRLDTYFSDNFDALYACDFEGWNTYSLPRQGKDIVVTTRYDDAPSKKRTVKWNGHGFSK